MSWPGLEDFEAVVGNAPSAAGAQAQWVQDLIAAISGADSGVMVAVGNEAARAQAAEADLQGQITELEVDGTIPAVTAERAERIAGDAAITATRNAPNGVAGLNANGKVPASLLVSNWIDPRDYGAKGDGSDDTVAIEAALAAAKAQAVAGYGASQGNRVRLGAGLWAVSRPLKVPERVHLEGEGPRVTSIVPLSPFDGNCIVRNEMQDNTQEWGFISNLSITGHYYNQANAGVATTVTSATFRPNPTLGFSLSVASTSGYSTNGGTLDVAGKRVIYQGISGNTFTMCQVISVNGSQIVTGDAVTPITTNNVQGLQIIGLYANSYVRDVQINQCSGACLYVGGATNCVDFNNIWANSSNRDTILISGEPDANNWSKITAQYPGQNGTSGTFACLHVLGQVASTNNIQFQGTLNFDSLFFESNVAGSYGLWLENIGNVSVDTARLQGGGANYTGQVCVQIDSAQTTPLAQDSLHSSPILLQNLMASQVASGRKVLVDNVRSRDSGTGATAPQVISRYTTEDTSPGVILPWTSGLLYWAGQLCVQGGIIYQTKATFVSGAAFDATNWNSLGSVSDREHTLRAGTVAAFRETATELQAWGSTLTAASGTQVGASVPLLQGESYGHVLFVTGSTSATFGSNGDGHWHVDVYDPSGNLVSQTADQGIAALPGSTPQRLALGTTITPLVDGMYSVVLMVNLGTGGSPVAPTLKAISAVNTSSLVTGMPKKGFTVASPSRTDGTAPSTLGTTVAANLPYFALYT